jgi:Tfp pilus assembly protein PilV
MGEHGTWFDYLNRFTWWRDFQHWAEAKLSRTAGTGMFPSGFTLTHVLITLLVVLFTTWGAIAFCRRARSRSATSSRSSPRACTASSRARWARPRRGSIR